MKIKFSDFGRCLICCKNPCQCKKELTAEEKEEIINEKINLEISSGDNQ